MLRRNADLSIPVKLWLIPPDRMPDSLRAICGNTPEPAQIEAGTQLESLSWVPEMITIEIVVDKKFAPQEPFDKIGRTITDWA